MHPPFSLSVCAPEARRQTECDEIIGYFQVASLPPIHSDSDWSEDFQSWYMIAGNFAHSNWSMHQRFLSAVSECSQGISTLSQPQVLRGKLSPHALWKAYTSQNQGEDGFPHMLYFDGRSRNSVCLSDDCVSSRFQILTPPDLDVIYQNWLLIVHRSEILPPSYDLPLIGLSGVCKIRERRMSTDIDK